MEGTSVKRHPMTPREVEQTRIVARDYPAGIRETVRRLVDTIESMRREIEALESSPENRARRLFGL